MNQNMKFNTTIDFELCDGTKVPLTLTFYALYQLRNKKAGLYKRYNETMNRITKKNYDELDMAVIIYTAYICANSDNENIMSEEEFLMMLGSDRMSLGRAVQELTAPKKKKDLDNHSNKGHIQKNRK